MAVKTLKFFGYTIKISRKLPGQPTIIKLENKWYYLFISPKFMDSPTYYTLQELTDIESKLI